MTLDRLVAMVDAFIRCDLLCEGCEIDGDHGMPCRECRKQAADRIEEILKRFPSTDEVEVVRCKDCKNRGEICSMRYIEMVGEDERIYDYSTDNGYCSWGERREDGEA